LTARGVGVRCRYPADGIQNVLWVSRYAKTRCGWSPYYAHRLFAQAKRPALATGCCI